jgi:hypothetical protein
LQLSAVELVGLPVAVAAQLRAEVPGFLEIHHQPDLITLRRHTLSEQFHTMWEDLQQA